MRMRSIFAGVLALSLTVLAGCGDDSEAETQVIFGSYVRLADPSFESIEACQAAQLEAADGRLFNCAQRLTLNEDGTYFSVLTDIAEAGTFVIDDTTLVLTADATGSTIGIPIDDDGTLGDDWLPDPEADNEGS